MVNQSSLITSSKTYQELTTQIIQILPKHLIYDHRHAHLLHVHLPCCYLHALLARDLPPYESLQHDFVQD